MGRSESVSDEEIAERLRTRASIRRKATARGPDDRLANELDGAAAEIEQLRAWIEDVQDALTDDLENGVAWLNDEASKKFAKEYPRLLEALNKSREA